MGRRGVPPSHCREGSRRHRCLIERGDVLSSRQATPLRVFRDMYRRPVSAFGTSIVLVFVILATLGPLITPYGVNEQIYADARQSPSLRHLFGTDLLGRDVFSRVIQGTRSILSITGLGALLAVVVGTSFGLVSGYLGGWFDEILMRLFDSLLAIPALLLALVLLGTVGQSQASVLAVIAAVYVPIVARVVRSEVLAIKRQAFVETARLQGESLPWVLFREILPSVLPALSVEAALRFSYSIFLVASLGYLGVGVQPPSPDWGLMVREARDSARLIPWALYFPAGAIALLVVSVNLAADGLKRSLQAATESLSPWTRRRIVRTRREACREPSGPRTDAMISVDRLTISYLVNRRWLDAVRDVSLDIPRGQTVGLVGESGSGKTTLALALVQYLSANGAVRRGSICFNGQSLIGRTKREVRALRGRQIALIPQDPLASLNPSMRVGRQIVEAIRAHAKISRGEAIHRANELIADVRLPDPERTFRLYPHQLSGGMQQRIAIAMGLAPGPQFLILDEPTTGLDVTTEAAILDLVALLLANGNRSSLYISHDLGVVSQVADRVAVLYAGELVESGTRDDVFIDPVHPYTRGLLDSIPGIGLGAGKERLPSMPGSIPPLDELPEGCVFQPRCPLAAPVCSERPPLERIGNARCVRCVRWSVGKTLRRSSLERHPVSARSVEYGDAFALRVENLRTEFPIRRTSADVLRRRSRRAVQAVRGVSLVIRPGTTLGLVGESGSGKTTLARSVLGLAVPTEGSVSCAGRRLPRALAQRNRADLRLVQAVSQNPDQALNPYMTIGASLRRPLQRLVGMKRSEALRHVAKLLDRVGLTQGFAHRVPSQLSGGEKQRVAIARAFASAPPLILCDEATSSLDVSVQARILNLLRDLQEGSGGAYLFITHDLAVVAHVADAIAVMYLGSLLEYGSREDVLLPPYQPYTEVLLSATPTLDKARQQTPLHLTGAAPSAIGEPVGCPFRSRCPHTLGEICRDVFPPWQEINTGHGILCHIPRETLQRIQRGVFAMQRREDA